MIKTVKSPQEQEEIVADYLLGTATYRPLEKKYDVDFRIIHSWVMKFEGKQKPSTKTVKKEVTKVIEKEPQELLLLREELRKEILRAELVNTIIDIAEKDFKINIRKNFGTKH